MLKQYLKIANIYPEGSQQQLWVPYTIFPNYQQTWDESGTFGPMKLYILVSSAQVAGQVREE